MRFGFGRPRFEHLDRYLAQKDYGKALDAVADELRRNPTQFNLLLRQAEILGLAGDKGRAVEVYREVAEAYAKEGFFAKAIAVYKKVLRLDPELEDVHAELARLIDEERRSHAPITERLAVRDAPPRGTVRGEGHGKPSTSTKEREASALFTAFRQDVLEEILSSTALRTFEEGDIIVTEGEPGTSLFLIVSGEVKVFTRAEHGGHLPLAELGPGDFFGEVSLLTGKPRTATITAKGTVTAIELGKEHVDRIAARHPEVRGVLDEFYQRRAHDTVEAVIRRMRESDDA